jgi:hypothetical protein
MSHPFRTLVPSLLSLVLVGACSSEPPPLSDTPRPVIVATDPGSPGMERSPRVRGTAEAQSVIELFLTEDCTGEPLSTGSTEEFASLGLLGAAAENATTYFYVRSTNAWEVVSACSEGFFYTHDSIPPEAPLLTKTLPTSPSSSVTNPTLEGTAEAQSRLQLFRSADCSGTPLALVELGLEGKFSIGVVVEARSTTTFSARTADLAGNVSTCSLPLSYTHDPSRPSAPTLLTTSPGSPSSSLSPLVQGTADPSAMVEVFNHSGCEGVAVKVGFADAVGTFSIATSALSNAVTTFSARGQNAAGTVSSCSNPLPYTHDSIAPALPLFTGSDPESPSSTDFSPTLNGTAEPFSLVRIFKTAGCTGSAVAAVTASPAGEFAVSVAVGANTQTTFHAVAVDLAGNASDCSTNALTYVHDATPPTAPTGLAVNPVGPSNTVTTPTVSGSSESGTVVRLYNTACTGAPLATTSSTGTFSVAVTVAANSTNVIRATATDRSGNTSACSSATVTYTHDASAPSAPILTGTSPTSPGKDTTPVVLGVAEASSVVRIFSTANCTGAVLGTGTAATGGAFSVTLTTALAANATSQVYANARDAAGNVSVCSAARSYTHDGVAPARPVLTSTTPSSPSPDNTPIVNGTAEASARIHLYTSAVCEVSAEITNPPGSATAGGVFSVSVVVPANSTTVIYGAAEDAAGNLSPCSTTFVTYIHDGVAPNAPVISGISASPSNSTTPTVTGTASNGLRVNLYLSATCTGALAGTGNSTPGNTFSITGTVPANASSQLWAQAVDAAGNASPCSNASPVYTHDGIAPAVPVVSSITPGSPSANGSPQLLGTAEASSVVRIYAANTCTGPALATGTTRVDGGWTITVPVPANATTSLYARASDSAGNNSPCSTTFVSFTHDNVQPTAPVLQGTTPGSPATDASPVVTGIAEPGATVRIYRAAACGGTLVASGVASPGGSFSIQVPVLTETTNTLTATATDAASNTSSCSTAFTYVHDASPPAIPVLSSTSPGSPANAATPVVNGTTEANATVQLSLSAGCTTIVATGVATAGGAFAISIQVNTNVTNSIFARARDTAGNFSGCTSVPLSYVHDGIAPDAPVVTSSSPVSPSNNASPTVNGSAESGSVVGLFFDAACTGTALTTGTATGGAFHLSVSIPVNTSRTVYARATDAAGNPSACSSTFVSYTHDGAPPTVPVINGVAPASPSSVPSPALVGSTDPNAVVETFLNSACSGSPSASGFANASGAFSIATPVALNTLNSLYARARDAAGNVSACSTTFAPYRHDDVPPALVSVKGVTPAGPSTNPTPVVSGSAEALSTVVVYAGSGCLTQLGQGAANASGEFSVSASVPLNTTTPLYARAFDAAGNGSVCSSTFVSYTHDSAPPAPPVLTGTSPPTDSTTPSMNLSPSVLGTAEGGSLVRLFTEATCTSSSVGQGTANGGSFSIQVFVLPGSTTTFYSQATDAAGNVSGCSAGGSTYYAGI